MKIDARIDTSLNSTPASGNAGESTTRFRELFEIAKLGASNTGTSPTSASASRSESGSTESAYQTAVRELHEYLSKTPEQRMRDAILKSMGLTEEDIKNMPPEQQAAVEAAIKEKVKEKLLEQAQNHVDAATGKIQTGTDNNRVFKLPMF